MKRKMNTRSRKALSPVVASIILIAVTVAVSIAVAAWMGALSFNFMNTEQGQITYMTVNTDNTITVTFKNSGTSAITIESGYVNNVPATPVPLAPTTSLAVPGNTVAYFSLPATYAPGYQYEVKLVSAAGHTFSSTVTAPV
jgi:archaeal type IV pilus assembly protein PilA